MPSQATFEAGSPPGISPHTRARVAARAFSTRPSAAASSSSRARHTVGGDATATSTCPWWRSVSMSAIASPPAVSIVATSTSTRPRSYPGTKPRRASADESPSVSPTRSANMRTATLPACATTPVASPVTDNPADQAVFFTCQVPSRSKHFDGRKSKYSVAGQALWYILGACHPPIREGPRLGPGAWAGRSGRVTHSSVTGRGQRPAKFVSIQLRFQERSPGG